MHWELKEGHLDYKEKNETTQPSERHCIVEYIKLLNMKPKYNDGIVVINEDFSSVYVDEKRNIYIVIINVLLMYSTHSS